MMGGRQPQLLPWERGRGPLLRQREQLLRRLPSIDRYDIGMDEREKNVSEVEAPQESQYVINSSQQQIRKLRYHSPLTRQEKI